MIEAARHVVETAEDMHALGVELGSRLAAGDLVVLTGPLGAGKTTLTRGIGEGLGVRGPVQSPTFVIARTHPSLVGGAPLVHVDAYRLGDPREFDDLDLDLDRSVVVVEWGRDVVATVADEWIDIEIERPTGGADDQESETVAPAGSDSVDAVDADVADEPRVVVVTAGRALPRG
ncbi:tRNA (adenosine(37)-N6)-threonylcarbamoyltransferase complex ATPase subunit type 1 TsaE [Labedella phragmitis]|uniref:tRNA threonylcarbamoyladenosine biosynthesis protein TsaE n=1 Tax=Labedella phragmitis TaxID=2498849 RepID=A0A444PRV6_9MICO|nr:tRNA (adenosine(37)-N6)-threonylcarbamoyltransferase complex ATPase subunit type 1 TsaE [Labedella phragmitis]RWZ49955.1 tRNA (adenosine(37)-N6)-threonylcarbamoyltransferase complex ATPase subunit type 1 TsaE [Labedella phragmitis]